MRPNLGEAPAIRLALRRLGPANRMDQLADPLLLLLVTPPPPPPPPLAMRTPRLLHYTE
jgi:hypothetical protein